MDPADFDILAARAFTCGRRGQRSFSDSDTWIREHPDVDERAVLIDQYRAGVKANKRLQKHRPKLPKTAPLRGLSVSVTNDKCLTFDFSEPCPADGHSSDLRIWYARAEDVRKSPSFDACGSIWISISDALRWPLVEDTAVLTKGCMILRGKDAKDYIEDQNEKRKGQGAVKVPGA